jgi:hypothetical protein
MYDYEICRVIMRIKWRCKYGCDDRVNIEWNKMYDGVLMECKDTNIYKA